MGKGNCFCQMLVPNKNLLPQRGDGVCLEVGLMTDQRKGAEGKVKPSYVCSLLSRELSSLCARERLHFHRHEEKPEVKVPFRSQKGSPGESI